MVGAACTGVAVAAVTADATNWRTASVASWIACAKKSSFSLTWLPPVPPVVVAPDTTGALGGDPDGADFDPVATACDPIATTGVAPAPVVVFSEAGATTGAVVSLNETCGDGGDTVTAWAGGVDESTSGMAGAVAGGAMGAVTA